MWAPPWLCRGRSSRAAYHRSRNPSPRNLAWKSGTPSYDPLMTHKMWPTIIYMVFKYAHWLKIIEHYSNNLYCCLKDVNVCLNRHGPLPPWCRSWGCPCSTWRSVPFPPCSSAPWTCTHRSWTENTHTINARYLQGKWTWTKISYHLYFKEMW